MNSKRMHIQLSFELKEEKKNGVSLLSNALIELIDAVKTTGSISSAAKKLGFSYRHLWNEINDWEARLGQPLFLRGRGKSGELTDYALRLLWANKEVQAKYREQLADLQAGISLAFQKALAERWTSILIEGCADLALNILRENSLEAKNPIEINFTSSQEGLKSLAQGKCDLAGFNFPIGSGRNSEAFRVFYPVLDESNELLIQFASRVQGLIVAKGNPKSLYSLIDVVEKKASFLNRREGTGTRILLDQLLKSTGLLPKEIKGYTNISESQSLTAVQVASGKADVGISTVNVAKEYGLDFIPLAREVYFLAGKKDFIASKKGTEFLEFLKGFNWSSYTDELPGYSFEGIGKVIPISDAFR